MRIMKYGLKARLKFHNIGFIPSVREDFVWLILGIISGSYIGSVHTISWIYFSLRKFICWSCKASLALCYKLGFMSLSLRMNEYQCILKKTILLPQSSWYYTKLDWVLCFVSLLYVFTICQIFLRQPLWLGCSHKDQFSPVMKSILKFNLKMHNFFNLWKSILIFIKFFIIDLNQEKRVLWI